MIQLFEKGECIVTVKKLAKEEGMSYKEVRRCMRELEKHKIIILEKTNKKDEFKVTMMRGVE